MFNVAPMPEPMARYQLSRPLCGVIPAAAHSRPSNLWVPDSSPQEINSAAATRMRLKASSADAAVASCVSEFGGLGGVVANAGVWAGGLLSRIDAAEWSRVVSTNLDGVAQVCRAALPHLARSGAGSITIVSSVVGVVGGAGDTAYASAKAGLIGFARSLAKEVARDGIRVNVLAPGFVQTDMTAEVPDKSSQRIRRDTLLGRAGTVEEIAAAAIFLGEDATFCTGSVLTVDGGWSV